MKRLLQFLVLLIIFSCSSPGDKSVFEDLSTQELNELIERDSKFKESYEFIKFVNERHFTKEVNRATYYDVTYNRFHHFMKESDEEIKKFDESCFKHKAVASPCLKHIDPLVYDYLNFTDFN